jgi:hypothetical protein
MAQSLAAAECTLAEQERIKRLCQPEEMAARRDALGKIEGVDGAVFALDAQQPRHKQREQRSTAKHSPPVLQRDDDSRASPVQCVRWRRDVTAEHCAPTCKVDLGARPSCTRDALRCEQRSHTSQQER